VLRAGSPLEHGRGIEEKTMARTLLSARKLPSPINFLIRNYTVTQCFEGGNAANNNMPTGSFQAQGRIKQGEAYQTGTQR